MSSEVFLELFSRRLCAVSFISVLLLFIIVVCVRLRVGMRWRGLGAGEAVLKLFAIF